MKTKYCEICKETKNIEKFVRNPDGSIRKHVCKACYGRKYRAQLKLEMLEVFGWRCQCCGESQPYFLTLDHVNNDGANHRSRFVSNNNEQILADAKRQGWPKDKYQILCMNCNFAKEYYDGCPHKRNVTVEMALEEIKSKVFHTGKSLQDYSNNAGLKLGPLSQKLPEEVLRQHYNEKATRYREKHRIELAQKERQRQMQNQVEQLLSKAGIKNVKTLVSSLGNP